MSSPYGTYYAVRTKLIARKGRILRKFNWDKILDFTTVDQLADYMKKSETFQEILKDVKSDINRDNLETILGRYRTLEIEKLLHYHSGAYKDFLKSLLTEAELTDLSLILRKIARGEELKNLEDRFIHSKKLTSIPYNKLLSSKNVGELIENLRGTPYYNELRGLTNEDAIKRDFHIEMKLYITFYKSLLDKAEKLDKDDKKAIKDIIGTKIDLLNVLWIYRAKNYYNISPAEILNYSLEGGKQINFDKLKKLSFSESSKNFDKIVSESLGSDLKKDLNNTDISLAMNYYMYNYLNKNKFENLGLTLSYIYMLDIIINDLTIITEGIKYHLSNDHLKRYLVYKV